MSRTRRRMERVAVCVGLLAAPAAGWGAEGVGFEVLSPEQTGIRAIMQAWHDEELKRQGGKFRSHGWWPWGLTAFDFDNDGDLDLLPTHHGTPRGRLLKSLLKETGKLTFVNVTKDMGIDSRDLPIADGKPWVWDFDGDGWLDIAGFSDESKPRSLFNVGGKKFAVIAGFTFHPISHPGELVDLNGDGWPDLTARRRGRSFQCLYDPKGRTFQKKTAEAKLPPEVPADVAELFAEAKKLKKNRFLNVRCERRYDLNGDGRRDLIVSGIGAYGADTLARYCLADAKGGCADKTAEIGLPPAGAPSLVRDLNGDGAVDVVVAVGDRAGVYLNDGKGRFTVRDGDLKKFLQTRDPYFLRTFPVDLDNDGDADLVVSSPRRGREEVHENLGAGRFRRVLRARGWDSDPIAICDINDDGLMDVVIGGGAKAHKTAINVYLNRTPSPGNFCRICPRMESPNPYAVGALVEAFQAGQMGRKDAVPLLVEKAHPDATPVHLGLGKAKAFDLRVTFPGKPPKVVERKAVQACRRLTVTPDGKPAASKP